VIQNGITIERPRVLSPGSEDLLALARHDVNKNVPALLRGVGQLQTLCPQWKGVLRIVGRSGRQSSLIQRLHRQLPAPAQVKLIDAMPLQELMACMRSSLALISASSEEGFDYPVLEAKAEGIPTIVSDIPVHREFHETSSLLFSGVDDGVGFAEQVRTLLVDSSLWSQLSRDGWTLAERLSVDAQQSAIVSQLASLVR